MSQQETPIPFRFQELRASVDRIRGAGSRLVERIQRTAETYGAEPRVARLFADARGAGRHLQRRTERLLRDVDQRRTRIVSRLEGQTARLVAQTVKTLNLASQASVDELGVRIAECERRIGARAEEARRVPA